jgi:hypothetical protein
MMCLTALIPLACSRSAPHAHMTSETMDAGSSPVAIDAAIARDLERVRNATRAYQDIAAARADGFPSSTPKCLTHPTAGVMGYHYVDQRRMDAKLELERPEILLYARDTDGKDKLTAIEYIVPLSAWTRSEPPKIFGQTLKRSEQLKIWYLHVWAWEENPAGLFADYNPKVQC